jgi:hypothetical protein
MKNLILIILVISLTGCATVYQTKSGKLRAITVARNVYKADCNGCDTLLINSEDFQSSTLGKMFDGLFETLKGFIPKFGG